MNCRIANKISELQSKGIRITFYRKSLCDQQGLELCDECPKQETCANQNVLHNQMSAVMNIDTEYGCRFVFDPEQEYGIQLAYFLQCTERTFYDILQMKTEDFNEVEEPPPEY